MFKCVMGFMGEFHFPFPALQAGQVLEACRRNPVLIEEAICQILRQVNQAEGAKSAIGKSFERGMVLLGVFIAIYHPPVIIENFVEFFIAQQPAFKEMRKILHYHTVHQTNSTVDAVSVKELELLWHNPSQETVLKLVEEHFEAKMKEAEAAGQ